MRNFVLALAVLAFALPGRGQDLPFTLDSVEVELYASYQQKTGKLSRNRSSTFFMGRLNDTDYALHYFAGEEPYVVPGTLTRSSGSDVLGALKDGYLLRADSDTFGRRRLYFDTTTLETHELPSDGLFPYGTWPDGSVLVSDGSGSYALGSATDTPVRLTDLEIGSDAIAYDDLLIFEADGKIFRSDGTPEGTYSIHDGNLTNGSRGTVHKGLLYLSSAAPTVTLLATDGTVSGTSTVELQSFSSVPDLNTVIAEYSVPNGLMVIVQGAAQENELLVFDDIEDRSPRSVLRWQDGSLARGRCLQVEGAVLFVRSEGDTGFYLTDGTPEGTRRVAAVDFGEELGGLPGLVPIGPAGNGDLYFGARVRGFQPNHIFRMLPDATVQRVSEYKPTGRCLPVITDRVLTDRNLYFSLRSACQNYGGLYSVDLASREVDQVSHNPVRSKFWQAANGEVVVLAGAAEGLQSVVLDGPNYRVTTLPLSPTIPFSHPGLAMRGNDFYFQGIDEYGGTAIFRLPGLTGQPEALKLLSRHQDYRFPLEVQDFGVHGKQLFVRSGQQLFAPRPGALARAILVAEGIRISEPVNGQYIVTDTVLGRTWLTDATAAGTRVLPLPVRARLLQWTAYDGKFFAATPDPSTPGSARLYLVGPETGRVDSVSVALEDAASQPLRTVSNVVNHGTSLYFLTAEGPEGGPARRVRLHRYEQSGEMTETKADLAITDSEDHPVHLRSEAGVLRFELVGTSRLPVPVAEERHYYLFDPERDKLVDLLRGRYLYPTTARVGDEVFVHDTSRIFAIGPEDQLPREVYDYEADRTDQFPERHRHWVQNLTAHRDGSLLFHRGNRGYGISRLYPAEQYRSEIIVPENNSIYYQQHTRPLPIVGDQLLSVYDDRRSFGRYGYQLYDLEDASTLPFHNGRYERMRNLLAASGDYFYYLTQPVEVPYYLPDQRLYFIHNPHRNRLSAGLLFHDRNGSGLREPDEPGVGNVAVSATSDSERLITYTDSLGRYSFRLVPGADYTIAVEPAVCWVPGSMPDGVGISADAGVDLPVFGLVNLPAPPDLRPHLTSAPVRCGFTVRFTATVTNDGCSAEAGIVSVLLPESVAFADTVSDGGTTEGQLISWTLPAIAPGSSRSVYFDAVMPGEDFVGEKLSYLAYTEVDVKRDSFLYVAEIRCAIDPNDKLVHPARPEASNSNYTRYDEALEYTIRFQNTGNDTAFNVRLEDQLSSQLDPTSLKPVAASHPYDLELSGDGLLTVYFDDILLPDSTRNEPESHGFFTFSVRVSPEVRDEVVANDADIFFDFNRPIRTNLTQNTIVTTLDADQDGLYFWVDCDDQNADPYASTQCKTVSVSPTDPQEPISVFPNPSGGYFTVSWPGKESFQLAVYDPLGRFIHTVSGTSGVAVDLSSQPAGLYTLIVVDSKGRRRAGARLIRK